MVSSRSMPAFLPSRNGQQLLSLSYITKIFFKVNRLRTIEEKSPNHQHIARFLFLSHLSAILLTIKTMKNLPGTAKTFSLIPG